MTANNIPNTGIRYGLLTGLISMITYYILYSHNVAVLFSYLGAIVGGFIVVGMLLSALTLNKNAQNGVPPVLLSFRQFIRPTFTTGLLCLLIIIEFNYIMYNFVDKSLGEQHKNWSIALFEEQLISQTPNSPGATTLEQTITSVKGSEPKYTIGNAFQQFILFLVPVFMLSAVISFLFFLVNNRRLIQQQPQKQYKTKQTPLVKK